jgi:hypothetical protein
MLKQLAKKILDTIVIPTYQYCYDRLRLRSAICTNYDTSYDISHQSTIDIPSDFYNFYKNQNNIVIFGNSLEAVYASEMILLSKNCTQKNIFKGYIIFDGEKHYSEYCGYPIWNISNFPFRAEDVGVIIACSQQQYKYAVVKLIEHGFSIDKIYILEEHCRPLNENMLKNILIFVKNSNYKVIIHGANREGTELYCYLRNKNIPVLYFVTDIPFSDTFNGLPLRSIYDLIFENMEDKYVFVVGRYSASSLYELRWDKQSAFFTAENIQYHSLLSHRGLYTDINCNVHLDANLGSNNYRGEKQGLRIFGNWEAPEAIKIATLGGSTSDPFFADYSELYISWSEILFTRLQSFIPNIAIACGGIESYSSSQELLKFIRDIIPLKPNLVIDFSIVNDLYQYFMYKYELDGSDEKRNHHKRPFLSLTTERFYRFASENAILHNLTEDIRPVCFGIHDKRNAVEFWIDIMRTMYALGHEFGFKFLGILQPNAATYKYGDMHEFYTWANSTFTQRKDDFEFARKSIVGYQYILDYTKIFNDLDENPYMDGAHVQPHGNRTIAEHIHQDILRLGLLQRSNA